MARIEFIGDNPVTGSYDLFVQDTLDAQGRITNTSGSLVLSSSTSQVVVSGNLYFNASKLVNLSGVMIESASSDVAPNSLLIKSADAYSQAVTNTAGSSLRLGGGIGTKKITCVYATAVGTTLKFIVNGTTTTITEGVEWSAISDDDQTALALAAYISSNIGGISAIAVNNGVWLTPNTNTISLNVSSTNGSAGGTKFAVVDGINGNIVVHGALELKSSNSVWDDCWISFRNANNYIYNSVTNPDAISIVCNNSTTAFFDSSLISFYSPIMVHAGNRLYSSGGRPINFGMSASVLHNLGVNDAVVGGKFEVSGTLYADKRLDVGELITNSSGSLILSSSNSTATVSGNLKTTGQVWSDGVYEYTPTAFNQTIDWNKGNTQRLNLTSVTGSGLTASFVNGKAGASYVLFVKQRASAPINISCSSATKWPGGIPPVISVDLGSEDVLTFVHDGVSYYGNRGPAYS